MASNTLTFDSKGASVKLRIDTESFKQKARTAARRGIDETHAACVQKAKALVRVDTATLQGSIAFKPARESGGAVTAGEFGSYGVAYAVYQELGPSGGTRTWAYTPYLRPARDAEYPRLGDRVAQNFKAAG